MRVTLLLPTLLLAACGAPAVEPPAENACGAPALQHLVGAPAAAAEGVPAEGPVRIVRPGQPITMDYRADRLNFELDARDRIIHVFCG